MTGWLLRRSGEKRRSVPVSVGLAAAMVVTVAGVVGDDAGAGAVVRHAATGAGPVVKAEADTVQATWTEANASGGTNPNLGCGNWFVTTPPADASSATVVLSGGGGGGGGGGDDVVGGAGAEVDTTLKVTAGTGQLAVDIGCGGGSGLTALAPFYGIDPPSPGGVGYAAGGQGPASLGNSAQDYGGTTGGGGGGGSGLCVAGGSGPNVSCATPLVVAGAGGGAGSEIACTLGQTNAGNGGAGDGGSTQTENGAIVTVGQIGGDGENGGQGGGGAGYTGGGTGGASASGSGNGGSGAGADTPFSSYGGDGAQATADAAYLVDGGGGGGGYTGGGGGGSSYCTDAHTGAGGGGGGSSAVASSWVQGTPVVQPGAAGGTGSPVDTPSTVTCSYQPGSYASGCPGYVTVTWTLSPIATGTTLSASPPPAPDVFIADTFNHRVVEVSPGCTTAACQTPVGSGLVLPEGVAVDAAGDVFIADSFNNQQPVVEVPAGCTTAACQIPVGGGLVSPEGVAVDAAGDVFIADTGNNQVVEVPATGGQTTVGGGLNGPSGVAVDAAGDVFIADTNNNRVVEVPAAGGPQITVASSQDGGLSGPDGVAVDAAGDVFIADTNNNRVVEVPAAGGPQITVASSQDGGLSGPEGVTVDAAGDVFIADTNNNRVVEMPAGGGTPITVGSGLADPNGVAVDVPAVHVTAGTPVSLEATVESSPPGSATRPVPATWTEANGNGTDPDTGCGHWFVTTPPAGASSATVVLSGGGGGGGGYGSQTSGDPVGGAGAEVNTTLNVTDATGQLAVDIGCGGGSGIAASYSAPASPGGDGYGAGGQGPGSVPGFELGATGGGGGGGSGLCVAGGSGAHVSCATPLVVAGGGGGSGGGVDCSNFGRNEYAGNGGNGDGGSSETESGANVIVGHNGGDGNDGQGGGGGLGTGGGTGGASAKGGSGSGAGADTPFSSTGGGGGQDNGRDGRGANGGGGGGGYTGGGGGGSDYCSTGIGAAGGGGGGSSAVDSSAVQGATGIQSGAAGGQGTSGGTPSTVSCAAQGGESYPSGCPGYVTVTWTLRASASPASGNVTFSDSGQTLGAASLSGNSPDTGTLTTTALPLGTDHLTATYGGDATHGASPVSAPITVVVTGVAPAFTSAPAATFTVGQSTSFTVITTGTPAPTVSVQSGALPAGIVLTPNSGSGQALLAGSAAPGTGGVHHLVFAASNGVAPDATQDFTLTVNESPAFTSAAATTFTVGQASSFAVTATGFPAPALSEQGALPTGVTFAGGKLAGTPAAGTGGAYPLTFTASNGVSPDATQAFTLSVNEAPAITSAATATFTVCQATSFPMTATGFPTPSLTENGTLPGGVTFSNGVLSGTPAAGSAGTYPLTFTAANAAGTAQQTFTLTVDQAPAITSADHATFTVGQASSFAVTATGFPAPALTEQGALPTGVTFAGGKLAGTPAAGTGGAYPLTFTASNGVIPDATQAFTLTVDQAPAFTTAASTTFTVGNAGRFTSDASGYPAADITESGTLPGGVTFNNGVLSGTPVAGTGASYDLTFTASNGVLPDATQDFTLTVDQAPAITSADHATFTVGQASSFAVTATGFPAPALTEQGALPTGVTFAGGKLAGTPGAGTGGAYPLTFTASNGVSPDATQGFTLTVDQAPTISSANTTTFVEDQPDTFTVTTTGVPSPAITETGVLPTGVTLTDDHDGTATLSGIPTTTGSFPFTITDTNPAGTTTQTFTLVVAAPLAVTDSLPGGTVGVPYNATLTATGGTPPYTWSISAGALPPGLTLTAAGTASGTPTTAGTFTFTVQVDDPVTKAMTIVIAAAPVSATSLSSASPSQAAGGPSGGPGGPLPVTGADTQGTVGGAVVLLLAGAGLVLAARRRREHGKHAAR